MSWRLGLACAVLIAAAPAACGSDAGAATEVRSRLTLDAITVRPSQAPAGPVRFVAHNAGDSDHEFVVLRTDLPADELPVVQGRVPTDRSQRIEVVDALEPFPGAVTETLVTELSRGGYVLICNLPGHYQLGMRAPFRAA